MGERPSNRQLLDYLAATFVENGWSIKKMHRLIMLSNVYQESSARTAGSGCAIPRTSCCGVIRDTASKAKPSRFHAVRQRPAESEDGRPGNQSCRFRTGVDTAGYREAGRSEKRCGAKPTARSVYIFVNANVVYPMLEAFDAPNPQETCSRRFRSVIPSQSLILMNDPLVLEWSRALAGRVLE